jgi:four helix bundle protein
MGRGVRRFTSLRAWQACDAYKKAVYKVCEESTLATDFSRRDQLEDAVKGPPAHIAEGFGRFSPPDFARFVVMARASLMESQNHLRDAVDVGHVSETCRLALDALAEVALGETTGLLEYLQSPEALRNARRARDRRIATRDKRKRARPKGESGTPLSDNRQAKEETNQKLKREPNSEHELGSENTED